MFQGLIDFELEVAVIILAEVDFKDFINERQHVIERADRLEGGRIRRTNNTTGSRQ